MKWAVDCEIRDLEIHRSRLPDGGIISVILDVTQRRAGVRERQRLQAQLDQASRMEVIGQLAGGIAHDFNNLLGAISGFADFLDQDLPPQSQQHLFARRILSASERGKAFRSPPLAGARRGAGGAHVPPAFPSRTARDAACVRLTYLRAHTSAPARTSFRVLYQGDGVPQGRAHGQPPPRHNRHRR
ncbi:MAG TPA: hypothetical protein VL966_04505 [Alphaproteobacteria bacterium]|jgi:hypothetical protein|nr:hypothetical protein [Alphaproteobacteria bacterium]